MSRRVPDLLVEKLHLGELSPKAEKDVRARLAAEPGGLERLAALADSDHELAQRLRPFVQRAVRPPRPWLVPVLATVTVVAVAIATWPTLDRHDLRAKGDTLLTVHRLATNGPELLTHGTSATQGDRLQLSARLAEPRYLAILSVDGLGAVTVHEPPTPTPTQDVLVPRSFVLDDAPHFERFFLFTSSAPLDQAALTHALTRLGVDTHRQPELPASVTTTEIRLDKPASR